MAKVLIIRKTDKTIHQVAIANKATLMAYNNRLPAGKKWIIEEMEEKEAAKLPFIDDAYVTAAEATQKLKQLEKSAEAKDNKIAELEALLAAAKAPAKSRLTAEETIALIEKAEDADAAAELANGDERKTVIEAAQKKIASFNK